MITPSPATPAPPIAAWLAAAAALGLLLLAAGLAWGWQPPAGGWRPSGGQAPVAAWLSAVADWDQRVDQVVRAAMQALPLASVAVAWLSHLGDRWVLGVAVAAACGLTFWRGHRALALGVALATSAQGVLVWALKDLADRGRPPAGALDPAWVVVNGSSLPSGHTTAALVGLGLIAYLVCRVGPQRWHRAAVAAALVLAAGVGLSRVLLGVHHASDVLAGWCVGGLWLGLSLAWLKALPPFAVRQPVSLRRQPVEARR